MKPQIYDSPQSKELSIDGLLGLFASLGVTRVLYKCLSPNDNSKNQPYLGGHLTDLGFLPTGEVLPSVSTSGKTSDPKRQVKYTATLNYSWLSPDGVIYPAPNTKIIYYPQYPEVRLSGFVAGCQFDMGGWMDPLKKGRTPGRVLFLGLTQSKNIFAYIAVPDSRIANEITDYPSVELTGVFNELNIGRKSVAATSKESLLLELRRIHLERWIESKRLNKDGVVMEYSAQNGGGYTLEAELGITPNGYADPDYMGWEVKQFGVTRCDLINSKALTLMTPEPDGGFYAESGAEAFMRQYGYASPGISDRLDFTGRHFSGQVCDRSGLMLVVQGYDSKSKVITDAAGCIALLDKSGNPASSWAFSKLMEHWKRKHAKAAYIPSLSRKDVHRNKSYSYCNNIRLFEGTTFVRLIEAISESQIYYDPGIKLENASTKPRTKRRSQFRIKSSQLGHLYEKQTDIDVLEK